MRSLAVWRLDWLPHSETFIRDQMASLRSWRPLRMGRWAREDPLVPPDVAPFGHSLRSKAAWGLLRTRTEERTYLDALAEHEAELVHAHFARDALAIRPLAEKANLPLVVTFHGYDVTRTRWRDAAGPLRRASLRRLLNEATSLVCVSSFIADRVVDLGAPTNRISVQYIGIPVPPAGAGKERRGVLFVGQLVEKKGVLDLVQAYAALPRALRKEHPLTIAGDGPLRTTVESVVRSAGIEASVRLPGFLSSPQVSQAMTEARVFCAPSHTASDGDAEGFGLVFLEAAAHQLPVVAYRHGGVPEAVDDGTTGLLVSERDVHGLATCLASVLSDEDLAERLGRRGRERVQTSFDVTKRTAELELVFDAAADGRS